MIIFKLLLEATSEEKLTHLEHAEDHPINAGEEGFEHAKNTLNAVHNKLLGGESDVSVSTKFDGSPSIVFGHNPENNKFFVASKSAFNKNPKINYTAKDIDENHGHAPGLADKLKVALKHLPKVVPSKGVFQGDVMHSGGTKGDVKMHDGAASFTPNTITYTTKKPEEGQQAAKSKIGVAVHTAYQGPSFKEMKAIYNSGNDLLGSHPDVHLMDTSYNMSRANYPAEHRQQFEDQMEGAQQAHEQLKGKGYGALSKHTDHLKTYINSTVRENTFPSVKGYQSHLQQWHEKEAGKVKTEAAKDKKLAAGKELNDHVSSNARHFENGFKLHRHLQNAKNALVHALSTHTDYDHTVGSKSVKPEGYVAVINNRPTKLVDREEFSRLNFENSRNR